MSSGNSLPAHTRFLLAVTAAGLGGAAPRPDPDIHWPDIHWPDIHWPRFLPAVRHHRVVPLMGPALDLDGPVPAAIRADLTRLRKAVAMQTLGLGAELARIAAAFGSMGVEVLALKGPAQSVLFYGDPGRRWCRDIDLLVRPEDEAAALTILRGLGYGEDAGTTIRNVNAVSVRRRGSPFPVELHTHPAEDERILSGAALRPFETAVPVTVCGEPIRTLATETAVVFAAHHGAKHLWLRLYWLADMAAIAHRGTIDWESALDLARRTGTDRHLGLAMLLVQDLIGLPLPAPIAADTRLTAAAHRAAAALRPALFQSWSDNDDLPFRRLGRLRYLWWDQSLYCRPAAKWAVLTTPARPTDRDRQAVRLPSGLGFFYYIVRVVRVLYEAWAAWRRGREQGGS